MKSRVIKKSLSPNYFYNIDNVRICQNNEYNTPKIYLNWECQNINVFNNRYATITRYLSLKIMLITNHTYSIWYISRRLQIGNVQKLLQCHNENSNEISW